MRFSLHHVAINTNDYQGTVAFYRDLLGFVLIEEVYVRSIGAWRAYLAAETLDWTAAARQPTLEILNYETPLRAGVDASQHQGLRHLGLAVPNVEKACQMLERAGIALTMSPTTASGSIRCKAMFLDPNGVEIELVELAPQESPG